MHFLRPAILGALFLSVSFCPAGLALDEALAPETMAELSADVAAYTQANDVVVFLNQRAALVGSFYTEAEKLAGHDFESAAPRYFAMLAVLHAALNSPQLGREPTEIVAREEAIAWNRINTRQDAWIKTRTEPRPYQVAEVQRDYANGTIVRAIKDYNAEVAARTEARDQIGREVQRLLRNAGPALQAERTRIDALRADLAARLEHLKSVEADLQRQRNKLDDDTSDYHRETSVLKRDVALYDKMVSSDRKREIYDELDHRRFTLNLEADDLEREASAWNAVARDVDQENKEVGSFGREIAAQAKAFDDRLTTLKKAQETVSAH